MTQDRTEDRSINGSLAPPGSTGVVPAPLTPDVHSFPWVIPTMYIVSAMEGET
jgi:hypothetical protein